MNEMLNIVGRWQLDLKKVRERMYRAPTPRERERWHAVWLLARGWAAEQVAEALERDGRTIAEWIADFEQQGPAGMSFAQSGGSPRPQPGATSGTEGCGAGSAQCGRAGSGEMELESGVPVCTGALWRESQ